MENIGNVINEFKNTRSLLVGWVIVSQQHIIKDIPFIIMLVAHQAVYSGPSSCW